MFVSVPLFRDGAAEGWHDAGVQTPGWLDEADKPPNAGQVAAVYRALRKGLEDNRDEPGAADFYYGEQRRWSGPNRQSRPCLRATQTRLPLNSR
ncbi:MAG TPA: hypothetical protein VK672_07175 [Solirubrobacteraceae bacterium]|nr:hypothetical protein [Solirubrobacteraceae bacterium]